MLVNSIFAQNTTYVSMFSERCEIALAKAAKPENNEQILAVRNKIKTLVDHINGVKDELYKTKDLASMSEKYWRNVRSITKHS